MSDERWEITLVHGTWPRGILPRLRWRKSEPLWCEPGSYFRERLAQDLRLHSAEASISSFEWTGRNSIEARDEAGAALAKRLTESRGRNPTARQILIGHSHGGTVCARTLHHLPADVSDIHVVTLATPFIEIFPSRMSLAGLGHGFAVMSAAALMAAATLLFPSDFPGLVTAVLMAAALLGLVVPPLLSAWQMAQGVTFRAEFVERLVAATSLRALETKRAKMLILRAIDDEATLALAAGAIAARVSEWVVHLTIARAMAAMLTIGLALAAFGFLLPIEEFRPRLETFYLLGLVMLSVGGLGILAGTVGPLFAAVYGRELLSAFSDLQISSHSAPDTMAGAQVRTITRVSAYAAGRRHGIYEEPDCSAELVRWLSLSLAGQTTVHTQDPRRLKKIFSQVDEQDRRGYLEVELGAAPPP